MNPRDWWLLEAKDLLSCVANIPFLLKAAREYTSYEQSLSCMELAKHADGRIVLPEAELTSHLKYIKDALASKISAKYIRMHCVNPLVDLKTWYPEAILTECPYCFAPISSYSYEDVDGCNTCHKQWRIIKTESRLIMVTDETCDSCGQDIPPYETEQPMVVEREPLLYPEKCELCGEQRYLRYLNDVNVWCCTKCQCSWNVT